MKYEEWCKQHKEITAEADAYNEWADKAKDKLLCEYGPRISALGHKMYMGCGFHYSMEQTFGKLIVTLSVSWQPCANWCEKIEEDWANSIATKVIYESLIRDIIRAEGL